jgi:hypothetical protein
MLAMMLHNLLSLVREYLARQAKIAFIFLSKSGADLQLTQVPHRKWRFCKSSCSIRISGNVLGDFFHVTTPLY